MNKIIEQLKTILRGHDDINGKVKHPKLVSDGFH